MGRGASPLGRRVSLGPQRKKRRAPLDRARVLRDSHPELLDLLDKLVEGIGVEGMEALAPVLADGMEVEGALLEHGLLHIDVRRPEPSRVIKRIPIRTGG